MAINTVNNDIYICDGGNNRVQVFNKSFEFSFQFSEGVNNPVGISLGMNKVYVTQWGSHCLNIYSTEGKFLNSVGEKERSRWSLMDRKDLTYPLTKLEYMLLTVIMTGFNV